MIKNLLPLLLLITLASCSAHALNRKDYFSHLQPRHRAVLKRWLAKRTWLRPATEDDCSDKGNLALMRRQLGKNAHPYYSVGDFNRDRSRDFAVLLIDTRKKGEMDEFALLVFNGDKRGRYYQAYFERGFDGISNSYIAFNF
jgi:hypothetical protein